MKFLFIAIAMSLTHLSSVFAAPDLAMTTKCRKTKIFLHPKPTDDELKYIFDKVLPNVPKPEIYNLCRSHIGEVRAFLRDNSWDGLSLADRQDLMGKLLNDCCERKK